jgi:hypothetical protein
MMHVDGWQRKFDDPIPLPRGRQLVTLKDAARYIQKLPKAEQQLEEWQTAVARPCFWSSTRTARRCSRGIGVMRALHRQQPKAAPAPRRKRGKAYRII